MFQRGALARWNIDSITILSRNAERLKIEAPDLIYKNVELFSLDISKITDLPKSDYVIHAAASSDARIYINSGQEERKKIHLATLNYVNILKNTNKNIKTLYVSSGAVYGIQPKSIKNIDESYQGLQLENILEEKRDYTLAKRDAEELIVKLGEASKPVSIARCFAFVGKYLPRDQHFAIGNFIEDGLKGRAIELKANHLVYRSYMYADDLVEWLMEILFAASYECPIFNVGSDLAVSLQDLAEKVALIFGVNVNKRDIFNDHIDMYVPSTVKALNLLGLSCKFNLDQAISETINKVKE